MAKPFISVLIDTYNHERFIEQAIVSALEQDFSAADREIVVMDDGSTDGTPEIVRKFEPKLRLLRKTNGGQASAFNAGIPECRGEIISFLDGDDWWARGKLRVMAETMQGNPAVGMIGHGITEVFSGGREVTQRPEKDERLRVDSLAAARVFRLRKSFLGTSRMTLRAELARRILPVPESLVFEADEYLFTLAAALGEMLILREALTFYRIHSGNLYVAPGGKHGLRRKYKVTTALAESLRRVLVEEGAAPEVVDCIVEVIEVDADQMRLILDGGWPWETVRTENRLYQTMHEDAPWTHRVFRATTMVPAMFLPPRWFYGARAWLSSRAWYGRLRNRTVPVPQITRVDGPKVFKA